MTRIRKMRAGTLAALTVPAIVGATLTAPAHATVASGTYAATPRRTALTLSITCTQTVLTGQNPWA